MAAAPRPSYFLGQSTPPNAGVTQATTGAAPAAGTSAKPAAPFDWAAFANSVFAPIDYSSLTKLASNRAATDTDALVAGYKTLQSSALEQASARAAQEGQLGLATSKYLEGLNLGGAVAGDYANAAAAQRAAASGYSGGLQQSVDDAAAIVQAHLNAAGSPQHALNQGAAAGNVLYGLGGNLPAMQLDAVGPAVAAGLRALPAQTLGYGQQLALGQLGQGQQEASKLNADIVMARAKQGALAANYFDKLSAAARNAGQDRIANYYKALALKLKLDATDAAGHQIDAAASKVAGHIIYKDGTEATDAKGNVIPIVAGATYFNDTFGRRVRINADGTQTVLTAGKYTDPATGAIVQVGIDGKTSPLTGGKPVTPHYTTVSDATGTYLVDENTLTRTKVGGPPASAGSSYQDAFGRQVKVNADGSQTVLSPGTWENPVTHATYTVGRDGKFTPFSKGKVPGSTTSEDNSLRARAGKLARELSQPSGVRYQGGQPIEGTGREAVPYDQAIQQVYDLGPQTAAWAKTARTIVNGVYTMGENGRPYAGPLAFTKALEFVRGAQKRGYSAARAANAAWDAGIYPNKAIEKAILAVYPNTSSQNTAGNRTTAAVVRPATSAPALGSFVPSFVPPALETFVPPAPFGGLNQNG